jgi:hypothetical protein
VKLFNVIDFETMSNCNRVCPTCIRNSHPDREAVKPWFENNYLPEDIIYLALEQAVNMGFEGDVCLSHFNEPLMDSRLPRIARMVKSFGKFRRVFLNTNGDYINEELAGKLDGALDRMIVALYMGEPIKSQRAAWIPTLFKKTEIQIITESEHIPSHFSPKFDVKGLAEKYKDANCLEPAMRVIINHRRQYLLCCEDVIGNFDLGYFPDTPLKDYWHGKHAKIEEMLGVTGGRSWHPYCLSCPKT